MGKVILVGAGPGDASLITVKGLEQIRDCDVIVYDRLIAEELLSFAKPGTRFVCVGKDPAGHAVKQEEINRILAEYAKQYKKVVRLKGGDAFVFGRGGEEAQSLLAQQIPVEVIPGVTSAIAVPELAGIPATHRGVSSSFHVIAGHCRENGELREAPFDLYAKLDGTLIFLMGMANLKIIAEQLMLYGKSKQTPAAVISDGATLRARTVRGTLSEIAAKAKEEKLTSPAVIVIGETAGFSFGVSQKKREMPVGLTGTAETNQKVGNAIESAGGSAIALSELKTVKLPGYQQLMKEMGRIAEYDWVFFASRPAVALFFEAFTESGLDIRTLSRLRFAVIGEGTGQALRIHGIHADFIPEHADRVSFLREFAKTCSSRKILFPAAMRSCETLTGTLAASEIPYTVVPVYDVRGVRASCFEQADSLNKIAFFSGSGVEEFFSLARESKMQIKPYCRLYAMGNSAFCALKDLVESADWQENRKTWDVIAAGEFNAGWLADGILSQK